MEINNKELRDKFAAISHELSAVLNEADISVYDSIQLLVCLTMTCLTGLSISADLAEAFVQTVQEQTHEACQLLLESYQKEDKK